MAKYYFEHGVCRNWTIESGTRVRRIEAMNLSNYLPSYIGTVQPRNNKPRNSGKNLKIAENPGIAENPPE